MRTTFLLIGSLFAVSAPALAVDIGFVITPNVEFGPPGGNAYPSLADPSVSCANGGPTCFIFSSEIMPDPTQDVNLTDLQVVFSPLAPGLTLDSAFFSLSGPAFILHGDPTDPSTWFVGYTFEIDSDPSTPLGTYYGTATLIGGTDTNTNNDNSVLASDTFQIVITPEPAYGWAACFALALLTLAARRQAKPSPQRR